MAKANGTANPTYPMYSMGGWKATSTWSCSKGLGPWPTKFKGTSTRAKGLAGMAMRPKKNDEIPRRTTVAQPSRGSACRARNFQRTAAM